MNTTTKLATLLLTGSAWGCAGGQSENASHVSPLVSEVATSFTNYHRITKSQVYVNPELAMLCRGASKGQVEAARLKNGPHANASILVYMNPLAAAAFTTNAPFFPVGAVIVKQKGQL